VSNYQLFSSNYDKFEGMRVFLNSGLDLKMQQQQMSHPSHARGEEKVEAHKLILSESGPVKTEQ